MAHELNQTMESYENDFTVILVDGDGKREEIHTHGVKLASVSRYFDAALKAGSFEESQSRELVLEDISIEAFHKAFEYLGDPVRVFNMTLQDALETFPIYDRLDTPAGLRMCDHIFDEFGQGLRHELILEPDVALGEAWYKTKIRNLIKVSRCVLNQESFDCHADILSVWEKLLANSDMTKIFVTAEDITAMVPYIKLYPQLLPLGTTLEDLESMPAAQFGRYAFLSMHAPRLLPAPSDSSEASVSGRGRGGFGGRGRGGFRGRVRGRGRGM